MSTQAEQIAAFEAVIKEDHEVMVALAAVPPVLASVPSPAGAALDHAYDRRLRYVR